MTYTNLICPSPEFTEAIRTIGKENDAKGCYEDLTELEIFCVRELLRGRPRGKCTAPSLFGLYWQSIGDGKKFGIRFRQAIRNGQIPNLVCVIDETSGTKKYLHRPPAIVSQLTTMSLEGAANSEVIAKAA